MKQEHFAENMLRLLYYWHCKIDRPFKFFIREKMSLETYYCLQTLRQNGPMTMSEICRALRISKQQATGLIEKLYEYHFVERLSRETDRRFITICVTDKAIRYIEETIYGNTEFLDLLENRLDAADMERLSHAMETLLELLPKLN